MRTAVLILLMTFMISGCGLFHHHRDDCSGDCRSSSGMTYQK